MLLFRLELGWNDLLGNTLGGKVNYLLIRLFRAGRLDELIKLLEEERPNWDWSAIVNQDV